MKTLKLLFSLVFTLLAFQMSAQFSIGIKGGYVKAWEDYGDVELPEDARIHVNGFQVSSFAYYRFTNYLSVGVEPGFMQRGAACVPGWEPVFEGDTKLLLNYVELPLMFAGRLPVFKGKMEIFGKVGYGASMITTAYEEVTPIWIDTPPVKTKIDVKDRDVINRWDHGVYSGLGFGVNMGRNQVFLETDYYFGLTDVDPWNASKNRSFQLALGYMIRL